MAGSMRRSVSLMTNVGVLLLFLFVITQREAYAYLDPGTGSMIFQVLAGAALAGLFMLKMFWFRVKTFVTSTMLRRPAKRTHDDFK